MLAASLCASATPSILGMAVPPGTPRRWLALCHQTSTAVEHLDATTALLDLGPCTREDAWRVSAHLLRNLHREEIRARAALAPTTTLAQLALLWQPKTQPLICLTPERVGRFLAETPVGVLPRLHPVGSFPPEAVARLEGYGLPTLGYLARLDTARLCQQLGPLGSALAAVARGEALRPLQPTLVPLAHTVALRLPEALSLAQVSLRLDVPSRRIVQWLKGAGMAAGEVRLRLAWTSGGEQRARHVLQAPINEASLLRREAKRLLEGVIAARRASPQDLVSGCQLIVARTTPVAPAQEPLWVLPTAHERPLERVARVLRERHGRPLLLRARVAPTAIYETDRFTLHQYGTSVSPPVPMPPRARAVGDWDDVPQRLHWW